MRISLEPPRFTAPLQDAFFRVREPLALEVGFSGGRNVSVTWKKDDKLIWASYKYNVKTTDTGSRLEVLNADREEAAGKYSCEISNSAGMETCSATVRQEPPRFTRRLCDSTYKLGKPLSLRCEFVGSQRLYVSWKKDGKPIWASYKYNVKTTGRSSVLEILNCDSRHAAGKYSCEVENREGSAACHALVRVEPVSFTSPLRNTTYSLGGALSLPVGFLGSPPVHVSWKKDGKPIWASYKYNVKRTADSCELQVLNADREEAQGEYVCEISNSENSATCHCDVEIEPPRFTAPLQDAFFRVREPLALEVGFSGSRNISVTWKKDDKLIWASYKYNVKTTDTGSRLEVLNADREEAAGKYSCEISNSAGADSCSSFVSIEPPRFTRRLCDSTYKLGKPLSLRCEFVGSQRLYVSWKKDGKPIWASYKYNVKTTGRSSVLEILNCDSRHAAGKYSCEVENPAGRAVCHALVRVEPVSFTTPLCDTTYRLGGALSLPVGFLGSPPVHVSWKKDGKPIWASYKYNMKRTADSCELQVLNADREEAQGEYVCEISNSENSAMCHCYVTLEPVRFTRPLRDCSFSVGKPLSLSVGFSGSSPVHVSWTKDGKPIWASYKYNVKRTERSCELQILNADREEAKGRYSCCISNSVSQAESSAEVTLEPVRIVRPLLDTSYALGKPLFLEVGFSGSQRIHVSWTKDDKPIWASYKYNVWTTPTSSRLQILNSDREEAQGRYCVTVENNGGVVSSDSFVLCQQKIENRRFHEPPQFVRTLENCTFRLGEALSLRVAFRASERVSVSWRKDGKPIWASYKYNVKTTDCSCILDVLNADREEARGRYTCEISNKDGTDTCHAHVTLEPVRFVKKLSDLTHELGRPLTLVCTYKGSENAHATWKKDGKPIWASYLYMTRTSRGRCELDVLNVDRDIATGKYSCEVSNQDGSDRCKCLVRIVKPVRRSPKAARV